MSNVSELFKSSTIITGLVTVIVLVLITIEHITTGTVDSILVDISGVVATSFITSAIGERVAGNVASGGHPIINGLGKNDDEKKQDATI